MASVGWRADRVGSALRGKANRLTDLPRPRRLAFLDDMDRLGEAVQWVCERRDPQFRRMNYEILGNLAPFLHAHIWPRYEWESPDMKPGPVWRYPRTMWSDPAHQLGPQHDDLRGEIAAELGNRAAA